MQRENIDGFALPVRTADRSSLAKDTAFSIFSSASRRVSSITATPVVFVLCTAIPPGLGALPVGGGTHQCADPLTTHRTGNVPLGEQIEHDDRHIVVHAE